MKDYWTFLKNVFLFRKFPTITRITIPLLFLFQAAARRNARGKWPTERQPTHIAAKCGNRTVGKLNSRVYSCTWVLIKWTHWQLARYNEQLSVQVLSAHVITERQTIGSRERGPRSALKTLFLYPGIKQVLHARLLLERNFSFYTSSHPHISHDISD